MKLTSSVNERTVRFDSPKCRLNSITLKGEEFDVASLKVNFSTLASYSGYLYFDLIQRDVSGKIIGGETFAVEPPILGTHPKINSESSGIGKVSLSVVGPEKSSYEWTDESGVVLGITSSVDVRPKKGSNIYTLTAITDEGEWSEASISSKYAGEIVAIDTAHDGIDIDLFSETQEGSSVSITSVIDGTAKYCQNIPQGIKKVHIDVTDISSGVYIVAYLLNNELIDQKRITIHK